MKKALLFLIFLISSSICQARTYIECAEVADSLIAGGELHKAEEVLLEALRAEPANPLNPMLLSNLGIIRLRIGNNKSALEALDAAIAMTPNSTVAINNRAKVKIGMNNYQGALDDLDKVINIDDKHIDARLTRGNIYLMMKNPEAAKADFKKVLDYDADNIEAMSGIAHTLETQSDFEGAMQYYNRALLENENCELYADRALLKIRMGDLRGADEDVRDGLTKCGADGNIILIRGYLSRLRFRNKEAGDDLQLARKYGADPELIKELFPSSTNNR